jgi:hypothetical protein
VNTSIVVPWCGQMRENAAKLDAPVRTIANGMPLTVVVATPPTFANAGKSDTLMLVTATVPGDVRKSPVVVLHAASAMAASAAAAPTTNSRRAMVRGSPPATHGQTCADVASTGVSSILRI